MTGVNPYSGVEADNENLTGKQQLAYELSQMTAEDLLGPERQPNEDFDEYKVRRKKENDWTKFYLRGEWLWVAKSMQFVPYEEGSDEGYYMNAGGGTYKKDVHGLLTPEQTEKANKKKHRDSKRGCGNVNE